MSKPISLTRSIVLTLPWILVASACAAGSGIEAPSEVVVTEAVATTATTAAPPASSVEPTASSSTTSLAATTTVPPAPVIDDAVLAAASVNELGSIPVLEYHLIEEPEARWSRTPANFQADIDRLMEEGYYPINLIDLADGFIDVPLGLSPVVLTFDDSSLGQCRYTESGTPDATSACGILLRASEEHPDAWRMRATFFVLLDVDVPERILFGQPEWAEQKLRDLVGWGMEIGSHTISHYALDQNNPDQVAKQLALPEATVEAMVPGYELRSLSPPFGIYPSDDVVLVSGSWGDSSYDLDAAVHVAGGVSVSPFDPVFDPLHITRVQATQGDIDEVLGHLAANPADRFISDGDPSRVSIPGTLDGAVPRSDLPDDVTVYVYAPGA
jgi:peptidoglycan/xylan/chitin deacetylase (PgdA/CDA1 family)